MISGSRQGPFELESLADAGVTPDTYVWCKGMPDWMQAAEVPDICRFFRQRLAGIAPKEVSTSQTSQEEADKNGKSGGVSFFRGFPGESLPTPEEINGERGHHAKALPVVLFILFFLILIFGFFLRYLL